ncbi:unnamed protein product [Parnassius mnemosyne]|uniref:Uncharacterized protein n=1 Tax=Parnassius mnemosyne TaxID=213953 RepID=A0AAV1L4I9_9NEOP
MWHEVLLIVLLLNLVCEIFSNKVNVQKKDRAIELDSNHDIKIDKDTIITRNMKLNKKNRAIMEKNINNNDNEEREPPHWSYSSFPQDVALHAEQFKRNMTECLKEVHAKEKKTIKQLSPRKKSPIHGECLIACVLKRNGVISNGKIYKDNLIVLLRKFFASDTKLLKKLDKNLDRCIEASSHNKDECAMAAQLNDCTNDLMANNKHKIFVNY